MKIHSNSTLLMTGDLVTGCGRARPVAEAVGGDIGNGYVGLIHAELSATCPGSTSASATPASLVIPCVIWPPAGNSMSWT